MVRLSYRCGAHIDVCCNAVFPVLYLFLQTDIPDFRQTDMEVCRRFSDFLGLHEKLVVKHLHHGCIIPPAPQKSVIGRSLGLLLMISISHVIIISYIISMISYHIISYHTISYHTRYHIISYHIISYHIIL